ASGRTLKSPTFDRIIIPKNHKDNIFTMFCRSAIKPGMAMDTLAPALTDRRYFIAGRAGSLSSQIVEQVRDDLFEKRLKPGDFLGTEKELAARYEVSRMAARDALRTLAALGLVEIKMGKGGGARIAPGSARLSAGARAVQLALPGVTAAEILDAQRAIECRAAELAALNAPAADHTRLRRLLADAEATIGDNESFTRTSLEF